MASTRKTGKAGSVIVAGTTVNITSWDLKGTKTMADATDTGDYDAVVGLTAKTQLPVDYQWEGTVEGYYDFSGKSAAVAAAFFAAPTVACNFKFDSSTSFGTGQFDVTDFNPKSPREGTIPCSFTVKSNGAFAMTA